MLAPPPSSLSPSLTPAFSPFLSRAILVLQLPASHVFLLLLHRTLDLCNPSKYLRTSGPSASTSRSRPFVHLRSLPALNPAMQPTSHLFRQQHARSQGCKTKFERCAFHWQLAFLVPHIYRVKITCAAAKGLRLRRRQFRQAFAGWPCSTVDSFAIFVRSKLRSNRSQG
jgi:hypothetical protein